MGNAEVCGKALQRLSTRHVENGVGLVSVLLQGLDRFSRGKNEQLDSAALGFEFHFFHYRQSTMRPGADHQPPAFPGDRLLDGQRRVSELVSKLLRRLLRPLADLAAINDHVVLVGDAVDPNRTKGKLFDVHIHLQPLFAHWVSTGLFLTNAKGSCLRPSSA